MSPGSLLRVPLAFAYLLGAGAGARNDGRARILMLHGTPRRLAGRLERALRWLRRRFDVVPLAQLARDAAAGDVRFRRQVALTFDDGLRNNVEVAYPILARLGLPATFFVCPGLLERGEWLWNHEARARLRHRGMAPRAVEAEIEAMKRSPLVTRMAMQESLRAQTPDFAPSAEQRHAHDLATWDELAALDPALVTIGAHTMTHPILTSLDAAGLEREIAGCRRVLEGRLQRPVDLFAYPNGDFDAPVLAVARRTYGAAVTVEEGYVRPGADPLLLPRVSFPWSLPRLALALHRERRAYRLVAPITTSGSQVAICGNATTTTSASTIMQKKGIDASAT